MVNARLAADLLVRINSKLTNCKLELTEQSEGCFLTVRSRRWAM